MKKQSNHLEKSLVNAAFGFYALLPWKTIISDDLFLVRVPNEDLPLVASVMGSNGEEYGLLLARGENAMTQFAGLVLGTPEGRELNQAGDLLSVSFSAWSTVADEFRQLIERAGQKPRREKMIPVVFLSPPYRESHAPGRGDMRMLALILQGINAALNEGALRPTALDPRARRITEIAIEQDGNKVTYATREVAWPESSVDIPALLMLPGDLNSFPRLRERWLFARLPLPGRIGNDDRLPYALVLGLENGPLLGLKLSRGIDLSEAAELITETVRGQGSLRKETGLPSAVLFNDHRVHGALAPALAGLNVTTEVDPESEAMEVMLDAVLDVLPQTEHGSGIGSLEAWKADDLDTSQLLASEIMQKDLLTPRAMKRYFGDVGVGEKILEQYARFTPHAALQEWFAADYRATKRSKTLVEKLLAKQRGLDPQVRKLLEARLAARVSVYRVDSCEPGLSLEIEDIFDGERFTVYDKALSGCGLEGIFLPLRLISAGQWTFPLFAGPPLTVQQVATALRAVTCPDADLDKWAFKEEPEILGYLWSWLIHQRPPVFRNTDGDELENQNATFRVANVKELLAHFEERPDLDFDEQQGSWIWGREGGHAMMGGQTVLGQLTLLDDRLLLEVNSVPRLERARSWLEATGAVTFESITTSAFNPEDRPLDDRLPSPPSEAPTPEMLDALKSMMLEHYKRWIDEPVPMLGNLTPRQACKSAEGRRKVEQMVRTMPAMQTPTGPLEVPRAKILGELGIGKSEA